MIPIWVGGINVHKCAVTSRTTRIVASMLLMFPCVKLLCVSYLTTNVEIHPFLHGCCLFEEFRWFQELDKIASFRFQGNKNHNFHIVILQKSPFPSTFSKKSHQTRHAMAPPGAATNGADLAPPKLLLPRSTNQHGDYGQWGLHQICLACFLGGIWPTSSKPASSRNEE